MMMVLDHLADCGDLNQNIKIYVTSTVFDL